MRQTRAVHGPPNVETSSSPGAAERQLDVLAELSRIAARSARSEEVVEMIVRRVAEVLDVERTEVLELSPGRECLHLVAGAGWKYGTIGQAIVLSGKMSQAGYALQSGEPVVVEDLGAETRFHGPSLLLHQDVVSGMSVVIDGPAGPYGVFGAHTTRRRRFEPHDVLFLQGVAGLVGLVVARRRGREDRPAKPPTTATEE